MAQALPNGTRLGPYEIIDFIGAGGMGEVYRARDTRLDRVVAIKRLTTHNDRFEQEARAIAALNHPHICQIHDVGPDYLVLEYIEGEPPRGPLPADEAIRLALQIASALEEAHGKGIFHRDLKPANVMVTARRAGSSETGVAKLLDFGLAKLVTADADATRTQVGTILGTAAYMAPEQAEGRPVDARSDIFSFGALLYELLSGHRAFGGQTMVEALSAVLHADPAPLQTAPPIDRIVRRCLAKLPGQRYQTFSAVREALQQASHELTATPRARPPSIAVLPFANMSPDKENEYFSDGLAEEIITALTHVPGLKVIARTSAFAFRGKDQDIRRIAEALDVTHVLEGSVRRAGNRIRVTAQLITAADGSHLWSERYDRQLADIFAIQDEIAQEVTAALRMTLAPESAARRRHTPRLPAYDALLKARHYLQKGTPETLVRSRECYEQAGTLDPEFALVHAEIAFTFVFLATENVIPARDAAVSIGKEAQRALEIDPSLPEAHVALGLAAVLDYDWQEAGRHFQLGLARQSIPPVLRYSYALFYLAPLGRVKEAEEQFRGAVQEDPLNLLLRGCLAMYQLGIGKHAEGWAGLREALELDENFWIACLWLSAYYVRRDMFPEALAFAEKAYAVVPANWFAIGLLAGLLTRAGDLDRAEPLLDKLRAGDVYGAPAGLVCYHMVRNEIDLAADSFEKVIAQRDTRAPWILPRTFGDLLTSSPRWTGLARMMNLPER